MHRSGNIAVFDVGKTNAKVLVIDARASKVLAVRRMENTVIDAAPYPHFDTDGLWDFLLQRLAELGQELQISGIMPTCHGAAAAFIGADGELAVPVLDYEHGGPDERRSAYSALTSPFADSGSPSLPGGLNLGAQIDWLMERTPRMRGNLSAILTYPQYWSYRLSGLMAGEASYLGAHTDLWLPGENTYSGLPDKLGVASLLKPVVPAWKALGTVRPEIAAKTGLPPETLVHCGVHDTNATLYPHLRDRRGPFALVSTGTWIVCMAVGGNMRGLDPDRDTLVNVDVFGRAVPSAKFMGGREFEILTKERDINSLTPDPESVLQRSIMVLPAVVRGSGPFPGHRHQWASASGPDDAGSWSGGEALSAASYYAALMTAECLSMIGGSPRYGPIVVEGPFAGNSDYLAMLQAVTGRQVLRAQVSVEGTALGAAALALRAYEPAAATGPELTGPETTGPETTGPEITKWGEEVPAALAARLRSYASEWRRRTSEQQAGNH